jgi:hypothetical protein
LRSVCANESQVTPGLCLGLVDANTFTVDHGHYRANPTH